MNTERVACYRFALYPVLLLVLILGCARTAPIGNKADSPDSSPILRSSDDGSTQDSNSAPADTQTSSDTQTNGDTGSMGDTNIDSGTLMDSDTIIVDTDPVDTVDTVKDSASVLDSDTLDSDTLYEDTGTASDTDSTPPVCDCNEHQWCEKSTGKCWCTVGYTGKDCRDCDSDDGSVAWPGREGVCVPDSCSEVICDGDAICSIDPNGRPSCACPSGLTGSHCRQQWNTLLVPPFASTVAFDSNGNGWFATNQGLLYRDFNHTPEDTSDDSTMWYASRNYTAVNSIDIDRYDRKWIGGPEKLIVLNDNATPLDRSDDTEITIAADMEPFGTVSKVVVDDADRCWIAVNGSPGVYVIENISTLIPPDLPSGTEITPVWRQLYADDTVIDMAVDGNGLWLGGESLLRYIDVGDDIDNTSDDTNLILSSSNTDLSHTTHVVLGASGQIWVTTTETIFHIQKAGSPLSPDGYSISEWVPQPDSVVSKTGPVVATGPDGAKWLQSTWGALIRVDDSQSDALRRTAYAPRNAPGWSDISLHRDVTSIAMDDAERKWLIYEQMLYILDDGGTPMNTQDDMWTRVEKRYVQVDSLSEAVPDGHGGAWVRGSRNSRGVSGCADELLYISPGSFSDSFDDVTVSYRDYVFGDDTTFCGTIRGIDANGLIWFMDSSRGGEEVKSLILDDNHTPLNPDDDIMAEYVDGDESVFVHSFLGFDRTDGAWVNSGHLSTGDSLMDRTDDLFVPIAPPGITSTTLMSVAVDTAGYKWFGYNIERIQDEGWASNGLQCLNDGGTLYDDGDDTWMAFSSEDGMPFAAMTEVQTGGAGLVWIRKNIDERKTPQFFGLDHNGTPMDKSDDVWIVVYMGYGLYKGNATLRTILDFNANSNSGVWFGTTNGVQYLHLNN